MMQDRGKKIATIIIGKMGGGDDGGYSHANYVPKAPTEKPKSSSGGAHSEEAMDSGSALESASRSILSAIESNSSSGIASALKEAFGVCMNEYGKDTEEKESKAWDDSEHEVS